MSRPTGGRNLRRRNVRVLGKILYWAAVLALSIVLLIALVLFFESRDTSQVDHGAILLGGFAVGSSQWAELLSLGFANCELRTANSDE
jgi:hypothetical protein